MTPATVVAMSGPVKAYQTFGKDLDGLLGELNETLAA
jgi:hypothetical protein